MRMGNLDLDRYSINKIDETTFELTDTDTLQTWQIEILQNKCKEIETKENEQKITSKNNQIF